MSNCLIAQSGGPTAVINSSVVGLVEENNFKKYYENVLAGINGIEGVLKENIINLSSINPVELNEFKHTPSSGLGSCRYKLSDYKENPKEYEKIFNILEKHNVESFFYVGGNDSMDTVAKMSSYAKEKNIPIKIIGIPKTIDNDLPITDHTPGFGSAAKLISTTVLETYLDSCVYTNNGIFILETMGRDAGWLAASACLANLHGKPAADFIYLPEIPFNENQFVEDVNRHFKENNHVYIVVSEGIKNNKGEFISSLASSASHDKFGHTQLGGVSSYLKSLIINSGITKRVKTLELGVIQRCAMHICSKTDLDEAYAVGQAALNYSQEGYSGYMVALKRDSETPYTSSTFLTKAKNVANNIKYFPKEWISDMGNNVNENAYKYFIPLIDGNVLLNYSDVIPKYTVFNK